jgi:hypothetical protein
MPQVLVIGAMKCGTTSLFHYLRRHPEVDMARVKELNFFVEEGNWRKGKAWYGSYFRGNGGVRVEISPWYSMYPLFGKVPNRIKEVLKKPRFIYLLGDPVQRLVSDYLQLRELGIVHESLSEVLRQPNQHFLMARSQYWRQLAQYLALFPLEDFLLIDRADLGEKRRESLATACRFLGVDESFWHPAWAARHEQSAAKRALSPLGQRLQPLLDAPLRLLPEHYRFRPRRWLYQPFSQPLSRPQLSEDLLAACREQLYPDMRTLQRETGVEVGRWGF